MDLRDLRMNSFRMCENFNVLAIRTLSSRIWFTSLAAATVTFPLTFNPRILNPLNYGWLWGGGDISSSFSSWNYFRHAAFFQWPISDNPLYGGNISQAITFTDTPPLFAIPFKLLGLFTSQIFQYTGLQIALSFFLIIYFSQKIFQFFGLGVASTVFGSVLISQAPYYLFRNQFEHYSLNLMWVAIASIYLYVKGNARREDARLDLKWWLLVFIALTWMPYLVIYVFIFLIPQFFEVLGKIKKPALKIRFIINQAKFFLLVTVLGLTIDGYWQNLGHSSADGLGYYNANLLSFINPNSGGNQNWSQVLPGIEVASDGQYEGFAYLGVGVIFLIVLNFCLRAKSSFQLLQDSFRKYRFLGISSIVFALWATAGNFTVGSVTVLKIDFPELIVRILSIFRSSGRFLIPIAYLITFVILIITFKNFGRKFAAILIAGALILTTFDQYPNSERIRERQSQTNSLTAPQSFIREVLISKKIKNIIFVQPEMSAYEWKMHIIGQASLLGIPVNDGFIARINQTKLSENIFESRNLIVEQNLQPGFLYVLYPSFVAENLEFVKLLQDRYGSMEFGESLLIFGGIS